MTMGLVIKENQLLNLVRISKLKFKKAEAITNPFTITKEKQLYFSLKLKSIDPLFANAVVRITPYDYFAEDDLDPLVRWICRIY